MPLDHYVSQVHLKHFYSPARNKFMHAIRKSELKSFPCSAQNVCRIESGSANAYLIHDRAIEEFLQGVEPKYNGSVAKLRDGNIDQECIYAIAGFIAYVACCAPAAMRIHSGPLQSLLEATAAMIDKQGVLPRVPASLGSKTFSELLADGTVRFDVDRKYPQALGISSIIDCVSVFGNSKWEILLSDASDSPFFTSDFPVAIEATGDRGVLNRIVPLAPHIAVRIIPDVRLSRTTPDLSFAKFTYGKRLLAHREIVEINRLIVRCAEDAVFYRDDNEWVGGFVAKNSNYRIEAVTERVPHDTGFLNLSTLRIIPFHQNT
jgi:hypothetical protein